MDRFLPHKDELGELLQAKSEQLFVLMHHIDIDSLGLTEHGKKYFLGSHFKRMFFSIQTSAHLLYNSITLSKKSVKDIVIMDYGAGMGSLYILAKMIGCKQVIHNDILEEWKNNAQLLAQAIHIDVDEYIVGNIEDTLIALKEKKIVCDIITSRNVVEHIYKLNEYYKLIHQYQPKAIVYSSTTANFNNPAMNLQHVLLHYKLEKIFIQQRKEYIKTNFTNLDEKTVDLLALHTRGYERSEVTVCINNFINKGIVPAKNYYYTNTCEMDYGVWAENLLPFSIHKQMAAVGNSQCIIKPGFWDTHYQKSWKNAMGTIFNKLIAITPVIGFILAPFIYIIVLPKQETHK